MKKQQIKAGISAAVLGILSPLAIAVPASAATKTFVSRSNADYMSPSDRGVMSVSQNWTSLVAPVSGDTVVFPASANFQTIVNDFSGLNSLSLAKIIFNGEVTGSSSKSYTISGEGMSVSESIEAVMTGSGGDHAVKTNISLTNDATFKTTGSNTLSVGGDNTTLALGSNDLTLDASGGTISLMGKISGSGKIIKSGTGKVNLLGTPESFTGSIDVSSGEFTVGKTFGAANVTINGGKLKGSGAVGDVTMTSGAIAPGNSPGCLNSGDLVLTGGAYEVEIAGKSTTACEFDNMVVTGGVNLGSNTTLNVSLINGFAPAVNDSFAIILNDTNSDAVQGTFKGLKDGDKFTLGAYTYQINYDGGDGNDIVLLVTGTPSAPDTGVGSVLSNPIATIAAAVLVAGSVAGYRFYETRKVRR